MRLEARMWEKLRPHLVKMKLDPVRVENPIHPGTPDVNHLHGWVELKARASWPKRVGSRVSIPHYTPQQRVWIYRRWRAGGHAHLALWVEETNEWLLFDADFAARHVGRCTRAVLCANARVASSDPGVIAALLARYVTEESAG